MLFLAGLFLGSCTGLLTASLLLAASDSERSLDHRQLEDIHFMEIESVLDRLEEMDAELIDLKKQVDFYEQVLGGEHG